MDGSMYTSIPWLWFQVMSSLVLILHCSYNKCTEYSALILVINSHKLYGPVHVSVHYVCVNVCVCVVQTYHPTHYLIRKLMTASACCFSRAQVGSATWVWALCLFGSVLPSLAVLFIPKPDDVIAAAAGGTRSLWAEPPSCSIGSPSESLDSRTCWQLAREHVIMHVPSSVLYYTTFYMHICTCVEGSLKCYSPQ